MQEFSSLRRSATQIHPGLLALFSLGLLSAGRGAAQQIASTHSSAPQIAYSSEIRNAERALPQTINTGNAKLRAEMASASAISVGAGDFDGDGAKDLVTGYATAGGGALVLQRGSSVALAPTAAEQALLRAGQPVHPFVSLGTAIALPARPDFLKTADVDFNGTQDVVVAAKGGTTAYLLRGDGSGGFLAPVAIPLNGALSALELWRNWDGSSLLAAGVCGASGCGLQMVDATGRILAFVPAAGSVTSIAQEKFNNNAQLDLAVVAGGSVQLIDAKTLLSGSPRVDSVPASNAAAISGGFFVYDRRALAQLAVLDASGTLHILAREGGLDNTAPTREQMLAARHARKPVPYTRVKGLGLGWQEVETLPNVGAGTPAGSTPLLLRGRLTAYAMEDLVLLSGGQYVQISHKVDANGNLRITTPVIAIDSTSAPVTAAIASRMSADPRAGVVMANLKPGPDYTVPSAYRTITVNTTADDNGSKASTCSSGGSPCSLRSAIALANADATTIGSKVDVINLPAGTYTLSTQNSYADPYGDANYHLNVNASVSFVGAGCSPSSGPPTSCTTIINANGTTTNDNAFDLDGGENNGETQAAYHIYFSGMEIENGRNNYNPSTLASGGYNYLGGAIDFESDGSGTLSMNNMLFTGNSARYGEGGAIFTSNTYNTGPAATVEIDNSSFTSNTASEFGGALNLGRGSDDQPIVLTGDLISGNTSSYLINTSDPNTSINDTLGGGLTFGENETSTLSTITGTTFSANTANGPGGGIESIGGFTMSGSTVTGNSSNATAGFGSGGGIHWGSNQNTSTEGGVTITNSTITSNTVPNATSAAGSGGGGIVLLGGSGAEEQTFNMTYSRIYGNTNSGTNTDGLYVVNGPSGYFTSFSAIDNWWGCNGAATGTGCDTSNAGSSYLTPYTTLALNLSTLTTYEGGDITATASLGQNSSGTVYPAGNDAVYLATPITTFTLTDTGTVTYNPSAPAFSSTAATSTSYAAATAAGTTNATGSGTATVTVDGETVTKTYTIIGPPTIAEAFNPSTVAPNANSTVTFTLGNPAANGATVTGVAFSDILPARLVVSTPSGAATTCTSGTVSATAGGSSIALSGASIAVGATCAVTVNVSSASIGSYTNTTGTVTASNGGTGSTASATLTVAVTPTKLVYTAPPATPITVGGNAGTVSVALEDGSGNVATNNSSTQVTLTVTGPSSYLQTYTATASNGVATFNLSPVTLMLAGGYTYVASTSGLTSASASEAVNAGSLAALVVSGLVSEAAPGVAQTATVKAEDSYGNVVTSFTGTVTPASTDPLATFSPASYTYTGADAGSHNFTVTLNTAGTQTVTASSSTISGSETVAIGDAVLVVNVNGTLSRLTDAGVATSPSSGYTGGGAPTTSIAIDSTGDIFSVNPTTSKLAEFSKAGTALSGTGFTGGGISAPAAVAADGLSTVWVANGNGTISQFSNAGTAVSPAGGYTTNSTAAAGGIAIDISGNVWITTPSANTITEIIGGAAPVAPLAVSVTNVTTGARP